jgi:hypothetical protein
MINKMSAILLLGLLAIPAVSRPLFAQKVKRVPTVRHAIHELKEARAIMANIKPDEAGHSVKAMQSIDAAIDELSIIKK